MLLFFLSNENGQVDDGKRLMKEFWMNDRSKITELDKRYSYAIWVLRQQSGLTNISSHRTMHQAYIASEPNCQRQALHCDSEPKMGGPTF